MPDLPNVPYKAPPLPGFSISDFLNGIGQTVVGSPSKTPVADAASRAAAQAVNDPQGAAQLAMKAGQAQEGAGAHGIDFSGVNDAVAKIAGTGGKKSDVLGGIGDLASSIASLFL